MTTLHQSLRLRWRRSGLSPGAARLKREMEAFEMRRRLREMAKYLADTHEERKHDDGR